MGKRTKMKKFHSYLKKNANLNGNISSYTTWANWISLDNLYFERMKNNSQQVKAQLHGSPFVKLASPLICSNEVLGKTWSIPADIHSPQTPPKHSHGEKDKGKKITEKVVASRISKNIPDVGTFNQGEKKNE